MHAACAGKVIRIAGTVRHLDDIVFAYDRVEMYPVSGKIVAVYAMSAKMEGAARNGGLVALFGFDKTPKHQSALKTGL